MNDEPGPRCVVRPPEASLKFQAPFDATTEMVCTHGSGLGSHSWPSAFFALDLATPYEQPASIIRAAREGQAFLFGNEDGGLCKEPVGTPSHAEIDQCGLGWGNNVKVVHGGGYYSLYAHLDHFLVSNGQQVLAGQPIGVEGWTGLAGHRHLHFSVQKLPGGTDAEWLQQVSWIGQSVPFRFRAQLNGSEQSVDVAALRCPHADIGRAPVSEQPSLRGSWPATP